MGQGYVGLSLACAAAEAGFQVVGVDVDSHRIEGLASGHLDVPGVRSNDFVSAIATGRLRFTTTATDLDDCDVILICVPTPALGGSLDLSFVDRACVQVAERLHPGMLLVLESTAYPGTTENVVRPTLERSGLSAVSDFLLAYSPERIDPGNDEFGFKDIPRIVGGLTPEATGVATLLYEQLVHKVHAVSSCRAAESAKLLENAFRQVNIALVNELAMMCHETGTDVWEVIEAAGSKPFGFLAFAPDPGIVSDRLPTDRSWLPQQVRSDDGYEFKLLALANAVNAGMPSYVATRIAEAIRGSGRPVEGARILVLGVTHQPDLADFHESSAIRVMRELRTQGAHVMFHDPYVPILSLGSELIRRTELTARTLRTTDCVAMMSAHRNYDLEWVANNSHLVFDSGNAFGDGAHRAVVRL